MSNEGQLGSSTAALLTIDHIDSPDTKSVCSDIGRLAYRSVFHRIDTINRTVGGSIILGHDLYVAAGEIRNRIRDGVVDTRFITREDDGELGGVWHDLYNGFK